MQLTAVLFDLDGTLLPMDLDVFVKHYFQHLGAVMSRQVPQPQKLVEAVRIGTRAMIANRGEKTNAEVFWEAAYAHYGAGLADVVPLLEAFYEKDFDALRAICGFAPEAVQVVHRLQEKGLRVILATNPIFPSSAVRSRIRWAGLQPEDFEEYTTYENYCCCKPQIAYYRQILDRLGLQAEECLMVGNDVGDDMVAEQLGMRVFLMTDWLINKADVDISRYPHGSYDALLRFVENL